MTDKYRVQRHERLLQKMKEKELQALFITSTHNRHYITGFTGSSAYVYISADKKVLMTDFRYLEQAAMQCPDYEIVDYMALGLNETLEHIMEMDGTNTLGFEDHHLTVKAFDFHKSHLEHIIWVPLEDMLERLRMVKDQLELDLIEYAASIGDAAYKHILDYVKVGMREIDVALELEMFMKKKGASRLSFETIVASGKRSSLPHAVPTTKTIEKGDFVTLDFGCVYEGYCSDMTRTFVMGEASDDQIRLYNTVLKAQEMALEAIKRGMTGKEVDLIARDYIYSQGYEGYFGHGLGHSLGLEVHENPRLSEQGHMTLQEGMVVTIEPGIYIPDFGGVRIEDLIVITKDGHKNFVHSDKRLIVI
ncbi:aminopeptidase (Met-Xaa and Xaa-Pro, Xaa-Pro-Xaa) [Petrocella atlantisensis]|uniref:Aminopeptidase (Met-Xaa and Xaa-Pro, Xaa-Pro-Xaa) n=1 Tax=Petrocella atlantisensis TaxID=2173034 RepID=A0A3P7P1X7_9FIRM|nr:aminopeptidase P family protein [Petrocella atlantisensis]PKM54638.1 MAG: Xaa-Pro dipeptidase [Firmicutes bacterium HGW-Firmicutes-5]VDN49384.1 aminopeptidase (Met-Xaa and Xaa-Pro, Xaa-Pro-Xaa) [Petrocella atlantisensis]